MREPERPGLDARERVVAPWAGAGLAVVAVLGLLVAPQARLLWVVLLAFGIATIPQVLVWRHSSKERGVDGGSRSRPFR